MELSGKQSSKVTSTQQAEVVALMQTLCLGRGKGIDIYSDSRYVSFLSTGPFIRRGGLLTAEGKEIRNKHEILDLLQALWKPKAVTMISYPSHQKGEDLVTAGNPSPNLATQAAAKETFKALLALHMPRFPEKPNCTMEDE